MRLFRFLLVLMLLPVACFGGEVPTPVVFFPDAAVLPRGDVAPGLAPVPLTKRAEELRRVREQHAELIRSIPPTSEPTPTLTAAERSAAASARVRAYPEGAPIPPRVGEDWFDPAAGLAFYRDSGGDWTGRRVRETHTHRELFYYGEYPDSISNFSDRSIYQMISRELAFEAASSLPLLGDPTPAMIGAFSRNLGWELRDSSEPAVNLWTTFTVRREGEFHTYAVGGVMLMGMAWTGEGDGVVEYVTLGRWIGPVVVERLK